MNNLSWYLVSDFYEHMYTCICCHQAQKWTFNQILVFIQVSKEFCEDYDKSHPGMYLELFQTQRGKVVDGFWPIEKISIIDVW